MKKIIIATLAILGILTYQSVNNLSELKNSLIQRFPNNAHLFNRMNKDEIRFSYDYITAFDNGSLTSFLSNKQNAFRLENIQQKYNIFT